MLAGEICNRDVVVMRCEKAVMDAARLMRNSHVGAVIVVDERNGARIPVGLPTDRDIVIEVIASDVDPCAVSVGDLLIAQFADVRALLDREAQWETTHRPAAAGGNSTLQ